MKLAYLMNTYPMTSATFIRREIEAIEALGQPIQRYAVRVWDQDLVDPRDRAEREVTHYLLTGNLRGLLRACIRELAGNPFGVARCLGPWFGLSWNARNGLVRPIAYLMQAAYLRQRADADGITHIHVHFATNAAAVALLAHLMGGPTYSFTAHGPDEFSAPERLSFRAKIAHARFCVAISRYCQTRLVGLARPEDHDKIRIARCGIALEEFEAKPRPNLGNQLLVCVGRLCAAKGQALIPAAVAALRGRFPDIKVILVGDGESRAEIEAACRAHAVSDRVVLQGWASNAEVRALVASSRALLLPSFAEGLPIVIMEAFALGRPVISTRIAGIPELLDDTCGWLIPPGDGQALERAMEAALVASPEQLDAKGAVGRAKVEDLHDRRMLARTLLQLFGAAVAASHALEAASGALGTGRAARPALGFGLMGLMRKSRALLADSIVRKTAR
ncbi:glycosyltransferase family 4 protein [Methylobacterium sp. BTF04]|uniref:glycosyltransferase family 4 protein n=1 Tax=Methylobacterium sp. BTF04 TaxID=2708300 RepID=UPI0013D05EF3|nr:glycosyltransferase family 4 protein [Methylobacterium sp. BTF04]NEU13494.1 glycosyltransferase family 4 protein [Methylobacterium sp. BTF04]